MDINGAVILNKEQGISSFAAVRKIRRLLGIEKAGHTGTLDPMAEGVLVVCLGKHTRLTEYLIQDEKEYRTTMLLGVSTDTCDLEGTIADTGDVSKVSESEIKEKMNEFIGIIDQKPPIYSAVKVAGKKLYEYARKGMSVDIPLRMVEIKELSVYEIVNETYKGVDVKKVEFNVTCSKGTYIRSLCRDIGERLGTSGTMASLIRLRSGEFSLKDSYSFDDLTKLNEEGSILDAVIDPIPFTGLEKIELDEIKTNKFMKGIKFTERDMVPGEYIAVLHDGRPAGICIIDDSGKLKSRKRLI